jgi:hypothetical protein
MKSTFLAVRTYPDRKKPCLVIEQGNTGIVLATFRNEASADVFKEFIGKENECLYRALEDDISKLYEAYREDEVNNGNVNG